MNNFIINNFSNKKLQKFKDDGLYFYKKIKKIKKIKKNKYYHPMTNDIDDFIEDKKLSKHNKQYDNYISKLYSSTQQTWINFDRFLLNNTEKKTEFFND